MPLPKGAQTWKTLARAPRERQRGQHGEEGKAFPCFGGCLHLREPWDQKNKQSVSLIMLIDQSCDRWYSFLPLKQWARQESSCCKGTSGHRFLQSDTKSHSLPRVSGQDRKVSGNRYFHLEPRGPKTVPKSLLSCGMPLQHPRDQAKQGVSGGLSPEFQTRVVLSHCRWDQKASEKFAFAFPSQGSYQSHT